MNFEEVLSELRIGRKVTRMRWNGNLRGKTMWIHLQVPDEHSKMTLPYIYMKTADDHLVPWLASQTDILADDWQLFEE